jgi:hypothetical protein
LTSSAAIPPRAEAIRVEKVEAIPPRHAVKMEHHHPLIPDSLFYNPTRKWMRFYSGITP